MHKSFRATVVSIKQQHTAVVEIVRKQAHPLYKKLLTITKRLQVDTKGFTPVVGDVVIIVETKPMSKNKHFKVKEVVKK